MRLLPIAIVTTLVGLFGAPALAGECPMLQTQLERQVNNRFDSASYKVRQSMKEAAALHQSGKHAESVAKYEEAASAVNVKLDRKK